MIKDIKISIKTILCDPVTILALLITIVLFLSTAQISVFMGDIEDVRAIYLRNDATHSAGNLVMNIVLAPISYLASVFMGVIIAANLFRDRRNNMFDIISSRNVSFLRYYLSKLISFYIIAVVFCALISILWCAVNFIIYIPSNPNFDIGLFFLKFLKNMLLGYSSCLLQILGWPIFLSALTGVPAVGAVFNAIYYYLWKFFGDDQTYYYRFIHANPGEMQRYMNKLVQPEPSILVPFASDANIALLWQVGMGIALLVSSYFLLKWRFKEA